LKMLNDVWMLSLAHRFNVLDSGVIFTSCDNVIDSTNSLHDGL
jgi:hypothetical protein